MISELRSELASVTTLQQQQANDSSLAALATGLASITARVDAIQGPTVFKWSGYTTSVITQQNQAAAWAAVSSATQTKGIMQIQGFPAAGNYGLFAATRRDNFIVWTFSVKSMTRFNVSATMGNGADSADREHYMEYSLNVGASQEKVDRPGNDGQHVIFKTLDADIAVAWEPEWIPITDHVTDSGSIVASASIFNSGGQTHVGTVPFGSTAGIGYTGFISIKIYMVGNPSPPWVSWRTISLHPICDSYAQVKPLAMYQNAENSDSVKGNWPRAGRWLAPGVCVGQGC